MEQAMTTAVLKDNFGKFYVHKIDGMWWVMDASESFTGAVPYETWDYAMVYARKCADLWAIRRAQRINDQARDLLVDGVQVELAELVDAYRRLKADDESRPAQREAEQGGER